MMDRIVTAFFSLCSTLPSDTSRPRLAWASRTVSSCALKRGTKRRVIDSTSESAGMIRPNRYTNLSEVITAV